jgi:DNA-directed RNA polymerase subunit alpha
VDLKHLKSSKEESGHLIGHFIISNLRVGQGLTIGNALRRVLLANIGGTAITSIQIPGCLNEFMLLPYIREDVLEILLNLKQVILSSSEQSKISGKIKVKGPGIITANCICFDNDIKIINPTQYIATVCDKIDIEFKLIAEYGVGYCLNTKEKQEFSDILNIDAIFMPVIKVNYNVNDFYISKNKTVEILTLEITTNGSISPENALNQAVKTLMSWFSDLANEKVLNPK